MSPAPSSPSPIAATRSPTGEPILLTALPAITIDELPADGVPNAGRFQLWIWAANNDTVRRLLTIVMGSQSTSAWIPPQAGFVVVVPGIPVTAPLKVQALPDTINVLQVAVARKPLLTDQDFQP